MNVNKINSFQGVQFKAAPAKQDGGYENPISRKTERNLAVLGIVGGGGVLGALVGGFATCMVKGKKYPIIAGAAAFVATLAIALPAKLYNTKVNAFVKEKEMDVFSRDRDLKSNLTEQVGKEVKDPEVSLDKKLDDNLKLQMANKGTALGVANITAQSQG